MKHNSNAENLFRNKIETIPLTNENVFQIISLLNNPESTFEQIVEKLSPDVAARFLNIANSSKHGQEVHSIKHALRILGYDEMKQILVSSVLIDQFTRRLPNFSFDRFQRQTQICVAVSKALGKIVDYAKPEDLLTAAILHNIGKMVIAVHFEDEHEQIIALKQTNNLSTSEAEMKILGITHAEMGAIVLDKYHIPKDICNAVRYHDAKDYRIFKGSNYQLDLITREASRIVTYFELPDKQKMNKLSRQLNKSIDHGKRVYRDGIRKKMRTVGYEKIFPNLLKTASQGILIDLKKVLQTRDKTSEDNKIVFLPDPT